MLYVLVMVAVIVTVDIVFLRNQFWPRLITNVGIVAVFLVFYFLFLKRLWATGALRWFSVVAGRPGMRGRSASSQAWPRLVSI